MYLRKTIPKCVSKPNFETHFGINWKACYNQQYCKFRLNCRKIL